jgi:hypothetical protein
MTVAIMMAKVMPKGGEKTDRGCRRLCPHSPFGGFVPIRGLCPHGGFVTLETLSPFALMLFCRHEVRASEALSPLAWRGVLVGSEALSPLALIIFL